MDLSQISFGEGIKTFHNFAEELNQPGFDPASITVADVQKVVNDVCHSMHLPDIPTGDATDQNGGYGHVPGHFEWDEIEIDTEWLKTKAQEYGPEVIAAVAAHEVGHAVTRHLMANNGWTLTGQQEEFGADFVSGSFLAQIGADPAAMRHFMETDPDMVHADDGVHPEGMYRVGALMAGYDWAVQEQKSPFFTFQLTSLMTEAMHTYVVNLPQTWLQRIGSQAEPPSMFH